MKAKLFTENFDAIIIVGNGFDLSLGLKTSYMDFINSDYFKQLIKDENKFSKHLTGVHTLQNWIDIENELKNYSKRIAHSDDNFFDEFKTLSNALVNYLNNIEIPEFDKNSIAIKLIESVKNLTTLIIDFNYTNIISKISEILNLDIYNEHSNIQHIKIHGTLEKKDIIFGVEDKADTLPKHIFLKKSVNKSFQPIDFSNAILNSDNFVVFGHSLGATDHMYFEEYFKKSSIQSNTGRSQNIVIYHYGEESYYNLFAQIDKLTMKRITKLKQLNTVIFNDTKL